MIVIGADTHKRSHTVVAVNEATGRVIADRTMPATHHAFEDALVWARGLDDPDRVWAIEDCRHVSGAFERFLVARGERVVDVAPKHMAGARRSARERGKKRESQTDHRPRTLRLQTPTACRHHNKSGAWHRPD